MFRSPRFRSMDSPTLGLGLLFNIEEVRVAGGAGVVLAMGDKLGVSFLKKGLG